MMKHLMLAAFAAAVILTPGCQCAGSSANLGRNEPGEDGGNVVPPDPDAGDPDGGEQDSGVPDSGVRRNPDGGACLPLQCGEMGFNCGPAGDGCGSLINCGTCVGVQTCGGGGQSSKCGGTAGCVPKTCASENADCGPLGDGCGGLLDCGTCPFPSTCGGGGFSNICGGTGGLSVDGGAVCSPLTCLSLGLTCGLAGDGCGGILQCGTCTAPQTCGGGNVPGQCGGSAACVPKDCTQLGFNCGPAGDGCGGLLDCGTCTAPQTCGGGGAGQSGKCGGSAACIPKTCLQLGFNCGPAGDGCGGQLDCGNCTLPEICGGGGAPGVCSAGASDGGPTCTGLCLQQVPSCDGGLTTITGTVVAGTNPDAGFGQPDPIYNALVYVPNAPVQPFDAGVSCDQCESTVSGSPLVVTNTGPDGKFTLTNMPAGTNIPLVIQLGRWRRQVIIPSVPACSTVTLPSSLTRLPRNKTEGDIPKMAISSGNVDLIECVLRKMGIEDSEFTLPTGDGRIHMYKDNGSSVGSGTPAATTLYGSATALNNYDMVLFPCVGRQSNKAAVDQQRVIDYANAGGRVFTTHFSYVWLYNISPWSGTALWSINQGSPPDPVTGYVNTAFPKGAAFSQWLANVGASSSVSPGELSLRVTRHDVNGVVPPTQNWVDTKSPDPVSTQHLTFNTPVGADPSLQCGRVVYSDFHVTNGTGSNKTFPTECTNTPLTAQEKVLEFMLFDLSSCVTPDNPVPASCTPKTCADLGFNCGPAGDGCGNLLNCGTCTMPQTCGGGGNAGVCGKPSCVPKTCGQLGYNCGPAGDGCGGLLDCGSCTAPQTCGGGGNAGVCGQPACLPLTCQELEFDCGDATDGCGGLQFCGTCVGPAFCGGAGAGKCGGGTSCTPKTCQDLSLSCGPAGDGCGNILNCGTCPQGQTCGGSGTQGVCGASTCVRKSCADQQFNCGLAGDGCGGSVDCGQCTNGAICGGDGVPNVCSFVFQ